MAYLAEDNIDWLKALFEQDENLLAFLIKDFTNLMTFEKYDKIYMDELTNAMKQVESAKKEGSEIKYNENGLGQLMEQSNKIMNLSSANQNSYITEFTQKIIPGLKAFREEATAKKLSTIQFKKGQEIFIKKQQLKNDEQNPVKKQRLFTQCTTLEQNHKQELEKMNEMIKSYSSERAAEYKATFFTIFSYFSNRLFFFI